LRIAAGNKKAQMICSQENERIPPVSAGHKPVRTTRSHASAAPIPSDLSPVVTHHLRSLTEARRPRSNSLKRFA
jgi:hypothetical protein